MRFSDRMGLMSPRTLAQIDDIDEDLRTAIWNALYVMFSGADGALVVYEERFLRSYWVLHLKETIDAFSTYRASEALKREVFQGEWFEVYNILESVVDWANIKHQRAEVHDIFNDVLASEFSGYRFVGGILAPITDEVEAAELADALDAAPADASSHHLKRALELYSNRESPDYVNAVVQAIHAVESIATRLSGKDTLGKAMLELGKNGFLDGHQSINDAWFKMFGYASNKDGFRHGGESIPATNQAYARYFIIISSSMVNLLRSLESLKASE